MNCLAEAVWLSGRRKLGSLFALETVVFTDMFQLGNKSAWEPFTKRCHYKLAFTFLS
jgi:hypothetical protein